MLGARLMGTWRNWYTRTLQVRMGQPLEVQVLSCPPELGTFSRRALSSVGGGR